MKLPLKPVAIGLLLGILLTMFLEVATVAGTALLIITCTLVVTIAWWIVEALLQRGRPT